MYIPKPFEITDTETIFAFIEQNAFGQLISSVDNRPFATHVPFLPARDHSVLTTHLAKQNPQLESIDGQEVLLIFAGPHAYISPQWFSSPGVPTWNYQTVHIYGKCKTFNEPERLKQLVETLTNKYEKGFEQPWHPEYNEKLLQAIVGVEVRILDIQCKFKLSQNKSRADRIDIAENLEKVGASAMADAMRNVD